MGSKKNQSCSVCGCYTCSREATTIAQHWQEVWTDHASSAHQAANTLVQDFGHVNQVHWQDHTCGNLLLATRAAKVLPGRITGAATRSNTCPNRPLFGMKLSPSSGSQEAATERSSSGLCGERKQNQSWPFASQQTNHRHEHFLANFCGHVVEYSDGQRMALQP